MTLFRYSCIFTHLSWPAGPLVRSAKAHISIRKAGDAYYRDDQVIDAKLVAALARALRTSSIGRRVLTIWELPGHG